MPQDTEKKCTQCGDVKPASAFKLDYGHNGGLSSACRECSNRASREAKQRKTAEGGSPRAWKRKAEELNRIAHAHNAPGTLTAQEATALWVQWEGKCLSCGSPKATWAAVRPWQEAGYTKDNVQLLCQACERTMGGFRVDFRSTPPCIVRSPFRGVVLKHDLQK